MWTFKWTDTNGVRRQQSLSTDKPAAQMRSTEILRARDMALHGLGAVAGQAMDVGELVESYLADLGMRASDAHVTNSRQALARRQSERPAGRLKAGTVRGTCRPLSAQISRPLTARSG